MFQGFSYKPLYYYTPITSHMWIANPFKKDTFGNLFASHPPMEKRIERLEEMNINIKSIEI